MSNTEFLPWWAGAAALATVAILYFYATGRLLGVSGLFDKLLHWKQTRNADAVRAALQDAPDDWMREMIAATRSAYGDRGPATAGTSERTAEKVESESSGRVPAPATAIESVVFLASLPVGSAIAALSTGKWGSSFSATLPQIFGESALAVLAVGGVLVGFGTRMAGGCTSGHGLSGCSRFQPASLAATASFLGMAIFVSLVMAKVLQ